MFTQVRSADRRIVPAENNNHQSVMKAVYVVLEPQYQSALTQAAISLNAQDGPIGIELCGYLIEELRDENNYADFQKTLLRPTSLLDPSYSLKISPKKLLMQSVLTAIA